MQKDKRLLLLILLGILLFLIGADQAFRKTYIAFLSIIFLGLAYFAGVIAFAIGIIYAFLGFLGTLPIISSLWAYISFILAKIHYILFRVLVAETLKKFTWYQKLSLRIKNNKGLRSCVERFHSF